MPRWLSLWLGVTLFAFWATVLLIGVPVAITHLTTVGERPFTRDERATIQEEYPGGDFTSPSTYKWCDGAKFVFFNTRWSTWHFNDPCYRLRQ